MNWSYGSNKEIIITYTDDSGNTVTIGNEDIITGSFSLVESICSADQLEFGNCDASELTVTVANKFGRLVGKAITVQLCNDTSDTDKYTLGTYYVESDKATSQRTQRTLMAYDKMYYLGQTDVSAWYTSFWGTATSSTLSAMATSLGTRLGMTVPVASGFGSYKVYKTLDTPFVTATDMLSAIGELTGCSYHIGRDGSLQVVEFGTTSTTYELSEVVDGDAEEYTTSAITKVVLQEADGETTYSYGSGDIVYTISGNILMTSDGLSEQGVTYATAIYNKVKALTYAPIDIEVVGNPTVSVGQTVAIPFRDGSTATSYVFRRTLKGLQGMTDNLVAEGEETRRLDKSIQELLNNASYSATNAQNITVKDSSDNVMFSAKNTGTKSVKIGGFTVDNNSITNGTPATSGSVMMSTGSTKSRTIGGHTGTGWCFTAGKNFGATNTGAVYANDVHIAGGELELANIDGDGTFFEVSSGTDQFIVGNAHKLSVDDDSVYVDGNLEIKSEDDTEARYPVLGITINGGSTEYRADTALGMVDIPVSGGGYVLPIASASALGGIKVGSNLTIDSETGVLSATDTGGTWLTVSGNTVALKRGSTTLSSIVIPTSASSSMSYTKVNSATIASGGSLTFDQDTYKAIHITGRWGSSASAYARASIDVPVAEISSTAVKYTLCLFSTRWLQFTITTSGTNYVFSYTGNDGSSAPIVECVYGVK